MVEGLIALGGAYLLAVKLVQRWREFDRRYGLPNTIGDSLTADGKPQDVCAA